MLVLCQTFCTLIKDIFLNHISNASYLYFDGNLPVFPSIIFFPNADVTLNVPCNTILVTVLNPLGDNLSEGAMKLPAALLMTTFGIPWSLSNSSATEKTYGSMYYNLKVIQKEHMRWKAKICTAGYINTVKFRGTPSHRFLCPLNSRKLCYL